MRLLVETHSCVKVLSCTGPTSKELSILGVLALSHPLFIWINLVV